METNDKPMNRKQRRLKEKMEKRAYKNYLSQMKRSSTKVSEDFKKLPEETQINTLLSILNGIKEISNREDKEDGSSED